VPALGADAAQVDSPRAVGDPAPPNARPARRVNSKWTAAEVALLEEGERLYGRTHFERIAAHIGTRSAAQVKGRHYADLRRQAAAAARDAGGAAAEQGNAAALDDGGAAVERTGAPDAGVPMTDAAEEAGAAGPVSPPRPDTGAAGGALNASDGIYTI